MKNADFDVVVVGGGPAGSTCAEFLGKGGLRTALFDHSHPREKPCGGGVTNKAIAEFKIPKSLAERVTEKIIIESPSGDSVELSSPGGGMLVMREKFDAFLLERAKKKAAFFPEKVLSVSRKGREWVVSTAKRKVYCSYLVGADGVNSLVRKTVYQPIPKNLLAQCVGYHIPMPREQVEALFPAAIELYFHSTRNACGYFWIFPKQRTVTVGTGLRLGTTGIKEMVDDFIASHPAAKRLAKPMSHHLHAHLIPFVNKASFYDEPTTGDTWVLIGDAAGHVCPLTGEGIAFAMLGGKLAAEAIVEGDLKRFEKKWRGRYGSFLYWGARFQNFFYSPRLLSLSVKLAKKSETMREFLRDVTEANESYGWLFAKTALLSPKILLEQLF
ncbi:MAG: geranylgeranyl reductase family protein [Candidatus Norongarragalinales archaeon]